MISTFRRLQCCLAGTLAAPLMVGASSPQALRPQAVIEAKFAAVNRHSAEDIVAYYAENAVLTAPDFCRSRRGKDDVQRTYRDIFSAIPDIQADVVETITQGERVAVRVILRSRMAGRSFDLPLMNFFTVRDGRIVRDDGLFDNRGRPCQP